jgi:hypothetical protein
MKEQEFKKWLSQKYVNNSTVANRFSNCKNVENVYGDLCFDPYKTGVFF